MAARFALDTNVYIEALRDRDRLRALQGFLARAGLRVLVAGVVALELRAGALTAAQASALETLIDTYARRGRVFGVSFEALWQAGRVWPRWPDREDRPAPSPAIRRMTPCLRRRAGKRAWSWLPATLETLRRYNVPCAGSASWSPGRCEVRRARAWRAVAAGLFPARRATRVDFAGRALNLGDMRFASKAALLEQIEREHRAFVELLQSIPRARYRERGVWGDGWTVHDLLAHLTEWEQMFLRWYREGRRGGSPALPAPGYKWGQTRALNRAIWRKHHRESVATVLTRFEASYREILSPTRPLSADDLPAAGRFAWTGKLPLSAYLGPNTCSHYRTASKILKRWLRGRKPLRSGTRTA